MTKNNNEAIKQLVSTLKSCIFNGDFDGFDKALQDGNFMPSHMLHTIVNNSFGLFSFRSDSVSKDFIESEILKRELKWLSIFNFEEQITFMSYSIDDIKQEHIDSLKSQDGLNNFGFAKNIIQRLFIDDKFDLLDNFSKITNLSVCDESQSITRNYKTLNSKGYQTITLLNHHPIFCSIFLNYSENKLNYLINNNLSLEDLLSHSNIVDDFVPNVGLLRGDICNHIDMFSESRAQIQRHLLKQELSCVSESKNSKVFKNKI